MRHTYPVRRTLPGTGYPSTVGNLSAFYLFATSRSPSKRPSRRIA